MIVVRKETETADEGKWLTWKQLVDIEDEAYSILIRASNKINVACASYWLLILE